MSNIIDIPRDDAADRLFEEAGVNEYLLNHNVLNKKFLQKVTLDLMRIGELKPPEGTRVDMPPPEIMSFPRVYVPPGGQYHIQFKKAIWALMGALIEQETKSPNPNHDPTKIAESIYAVLSRFVGLVHRLGSQESDVYDAIIAVGRRKKADTRVLAVKLVTEQDIVEELRASDCVAWRQIGNLVSINAVKKEVIEGEGPFYSIVF